jgi:CheY-like chemotaxis protein
VVLVVGWPGPVARAEKPPAANDIDAPSMSREQHRCSIDVASGRASQHHAAAPVPNTQNPARRRQHWPEDATLTRVTQGLGRVLVVDDDEVIRRLIAVNLQLEGFDVETAVDGQDCLDKVTEIGPDVITLDVMMPRLDGWETAVQLRESPETAHIKVVLITARAQEDDKTRGSSVGADAYLTKPFDPNEMIRVVRELAGLAPLSPPSTSPPSTP